jgi:hypothetical protein
MKTSLRSFTVTIMTVMLSITFFIAQVSGQVILNNSSTSFSIEHSTFNGLTIHNSFTSFNSQNIETEEGYFTEISADKYSYMQEPGFPKLPVIRKLISIPIGSTIEIRVVASEIMEFKLSDLGITNQLIPAQPPVAKSSKSKPEFVINRKVYNENKYIGSEPASYEVLGLLRDKRLARIDLAPVQYNPVTGMIKVYINMEVEVKFINGDYQATLELMEKTKSHYFNLDKLFANRLPIEQSREDITQYPVTMVIVSDPMFQAALQPLIDWKTKKGFKIIEAYTNNPAVGTTTTSIKNYLQGLYNAGTPTDPSPSFVLFVGDVDQIPAFNTGQHVTDLYYCEYTNDYMPEVYYGRFSANNLDQLQPQIDKTLMYEQYLFPNPAFLGECVMIAGVDASWAPVHANGQINYGTTYYYNPDHGFLSHTYLYPASGSASAQIIQNVSDGVGFANYTAHGSASGWADPSFQISDIPGLQNNGEYPLMIGNCCQTSMYGTNCFAEELLRAPNKGAIGYIGGSNNTYWDEDFYFAVGVGQIVVNPTYEGTSLGEYDRSFHDHGEPFADWYTTMDQLIFAGNLAVMEGSPSRAEYYWEIYCLMGDPSLTAYMSEPPVMTVTHEPLMLLNSTEFTVTAEPYAYVAISKGGVLHGAALANEAGVAVVSLDPITVPGNADIIVTAQNMQPHIGTVLVASPDGPYIMLDYQSVNDPAGNNNMQADYNEVFGFNIGLENVGGAEATNLVVSIETDSPYLMVREDTEEWDDIPAGTTVNNPLAFTISATDLIPDQVTATFTLTITDSIDIWVYEFNTILNAPVLSLNEVIVDDAQAANPNGRIDAGETVIYKVPVANIGHSDAHSLMAYLFTNSEHATISNGACYIGDVICGTPSYAHFEVEIADSIPTGTLITFFSSSNADPYYATKKYDMGVGLIVEDFETGDFSSFNWINTSAKPWVVTQFAHNGGLFGAKSGAVGPNGLSELEITMDVEVNGVITFARKVSSESEGDFLKFYIDGVEKGSWSGDVPWSNVNYTVNAGTRTFKWAYKKNLVNTSGMDAAYVDDIIFPAQVHEEPPTEFIVYPFAYPEAACFEQDVNLFAFAINGLEDVEYQWEPGNVLNNSNIYNPVGNLTEPTNFNVSANSGAQITESTILIDVNAIPDAPVIIQQGALLVSDAAEGNQWYNSLGPIEGATGQTYEPVTTDFYHATERSVEGCVSDASNEIYVGFVNTPNNPVESSFNVYPNPFKDRLSVEFALKTKTGVKISLLNLLGTEIAVVYNTTSMDAGEHKLEFIPKNLRGGVYFIKFEAGEIVKLRKLILLE